MTPCAIIHEPQEAELPQRMLASMHRSADKGNPRCGESVQMQICARYCSANQKEQTVIQNQA